MQYDVEKVAQVCKLLGDQTRLAIVSILDERPCCVCEFTGVFEMSQPSISQHLRKLKDVGLLREERRGQWIYYSLNKETGLYAIVKDVLRHVPYPETYMERMQGKTNMCGDK